MIFVKRAHIMSGRTPVRMEMTTVYWPDREKPNISEKIEGKNCAREFSIKIAIIRFLSLLSFISVYPSIYSSHAIHRSIVCLFVRSIHSNAYFGWKSIWNKYTYCIYEKRMGINSTCKRIFIKLHFGLQRNNTIENEFN